MQMRQRFGMVLAAPLFLASQIRSVRNYYQRNREPFLRLGLGVCIAWLALRLLSKSYETKKLVEELEIQDEIRRNILSRAQSDEWLLSALIAAKAETSQENIHSLRQHVANSFSDIIKIAEQKAKDATWLPDINLPNTDSLKAARERLAQESLEPAVLKQAPAAAVPEKETQNVPTPPPLPSGTRKLI